MSDTPTCFFLNPSFQSAYNHQDSNVSSRSIHQRTLDLAFATFCGPPFFFSGAAADFFPAFLDGAYRAAFSKFSEDYVDADHGGQDVADVNLG